MLQDENPQTPQSCQPRRSPWKNPSEPVSSRLLRCWEWPAIRCCPVKSS